MKTEILTKKNGKALNGFSIEDIGDDHLFTSLDTPMKPGAFDMSDKEKKRTHLNFIFRNHGCFGIGPN